MPDSAALAADVNIPAAYEPRFPDGIRVQIECQGHSRFLYQPYRLEKRWFGARLFGRRFRVEYADPFSVETEPILCSPVRQPVTSGT
jgi:hypothetical protein